jgi:hypothetical protein
MASEKRCTVIGLATLLLMAVVAPAALAESEPAVSALNPNRPAPEGFLTPTLDGDWRFRVALDIWVPATLLIDVSTDLGDGQISEGLPWILSRMQWYVPVDLEARKGTFGAFFHTFAIRLDGSDSNAGPVNLNWDLSLLMFDVGLSYEVGRWRLGDRPNAPELTLEPYMEVRIIHLPLDVEVGGLSTGEELGSVVPVVGIRALVDLTEHWNLEFIGDYGGWNTDNNHLTWQGAGYLGYRFPRWGAHWNVQVGYRAMQLFDKRQTFSDIALKLRGFNITLGVEF